MGTNTISNFTATVIHTVASSARALARLLNLAETEQLLPRKWCHYTTLNLRGIPRKHAESALRLQLNQLGMFNKTGFTYLVSGEHAKVWFWDDEQAQSLFQAGKILPYPEPLWRTPLVEGVRYIRCGEGFELEGINAQNIYRSRWFALHPSVDEIHAFYRDLGFSPHTTLESPKPLPRLSTPLREWGVSSCLGGQLSPKIWFTGLAILVAGCIATSELVQLSRLKQEIQLLKTDAIVLKKQTATITALESSIKALQPATQLLADQIQPPRQISLLSSLVANNVIGTDADVYISEWSYRNSRVATTLRLGPKAKGANVLASLEQTGLFSEIRLLPDPPANSLRIELKLAEVISAPNQAASTPGSSLPK